MPLAVAIIPIIVVPMVVDLSPGALSALKAALLIWAAFAVDYIVRFSIAPRKGHFLNYISGTAKPSCRKS